MSVRQRGTSWQCDFSYAGQRYRQDFRSKAEADLWEAQSRVKLQRGEKLIVSVDDVPTMSKLLDQVIDTYWRGSRSEETATKNAEDCINLLGRDLPVSDVTTPMVDAMLRKLEDSGISGGTVNRKVAALSKMLRHAYQRGWLAKLPHISRRKESEHRIRWVTQAEEKKVVQWFKDAGRPEMADFVAFLADTGLRLGEALTLRHRDAVGGWLRVWGDESKGGRSRSVPMTSLVQEIVQRRAGEADDRVWDDITVNKAQYAWTQMCDHLGFADDDQLVLHALRHTFCSRLIQNGVPLAEVQQLAGHRHIATTLRYAHLRPENLQSAVTKLRLAV
jgi:integrase